MIGYGTVVIARARGAQPEHAHDRYEGGESGEQATAGEQFRHPPVLNDEFLRSNLCIAGKCRKSLTSKGGIPSFRAALAKSRNATRRPGPEAGGHRPTARCA